MAIPFRPTGLIGFAKELDTRTRVSRTDIERLWRQMSQQSVGETFGNDPANPLLGYPGYGSGGGGGGGGKIYEGETTSNLIRSGTPWTSYSTCTVAEYDEGVSGNYAPTGNVFTITNRDTNLAVVIGTYVQFRKIVTAQGNTEYRITWVSR
ncbi:hypothetical protein [Schlesneria paludicola]|uniref:hypothetical protein n=1 Tax=Schlesneria paludicola TaxID=360056 RepID=UPI00029AFF82|nr:hypothetical protein [Schlesneria paludicola]